jgi:hypothetical protein
VIFKAVIDRFEGDLAVLLVGEGERRVNVPRDQLPPGASEGDWLEVEMACGSARSIRTDPDATERARERIQSKLDYLRKGEHRKEE